MPPNLKNFLNKFKSIDDNSQLSGFKKYFRSRALWQRDREAVARGIAAGLFSAVIPFVPFQMVIAVLIAILIRGNLALAILFSWISNPITFLPITYFTYHFGNWLLGTDDKEVEFHDINWNFHNLSGMWHTFSDWFLQLSQAYLIGFIVLAFGIALVSYTLVTLIWYGYDLLSHKKRKNGK